MNVKRIAWLSTGGGVLVAMIAGATTSGPRRAAPPAATPNTAAIELRGAELAAEVARLRARLRPTDEPQSPARNLFQFARGTAPVAAAPIVEVNQPAVVAAAPPSPPPFTLVGLASDSTDADIVRTAIISGFGDVFLVKEGETLASRYRVVRVGADGVDLTAISDGTPVTLRLQP